MIESLNVFRTCELLENIIYILATGKNDIRDRLKLARTEIAELDVSMLPVQYKKDWQWIEKKLTSFSPQYSFKGDLIFGSIEVTLTKIRNSTAQEIAFRIWKLYDEMKAYRDNLG